MSFDLYIGSFVGGEPAPFPSSMLKSVFAPFIVATEPEYYVLRFGSGEFDTCTLFVDTSAEEIDRFSVNRPLADDRLYDALLTVLKMPGLALYMPGTCPPLVGNAETLEHLPKDMIEALGEPAVLTAASEIPERIEGA